MNYTDEQRLVMVTAALSNRRAPWYLRARRRVAFFVGMDLKLRTLGYLIDYDRDRYRDVFADEQA